jgi:hypothetical protein
MPPERDPVKEELKACGRQVQNALGAKSKMPFRAAQLHIALLLSLCRDELYIPRARPGARVRT